MCKRLRKDIEMDKMICELEGWDFNLYLDDLKNIVLKFRSDSIATNGLGLCDGGEIRERQPNKPPKLN